MADDPILCPHCEKEIGGGFVAKIRERSRMTMKLTPGEGGPLTAETVAGSMQDLCAIFDGVGKSMGAVKFHHFVEALGMDEDGSVSFTILTAVVRE